MRRLSIAVLGVIGVAFVLIAGLSGIASGPSTALGGAVVTQAPYTLTKSADAAQVPAGQPIGFTIELINSAHANTMLIDDQLPTDPDINWVISPNSQVCQINPANQFLSCTA